MFFVLRVFFNTRGLLRLEGSGFRLVLGGFHASLDLSSPALGRKVAGRVTISALYLSYLPSPDFVGMKWGFPKLWGTLLRVSIMGIRVF